MLGYVGLIQGLKIVGRRLPGDQISFLVALEQNVVVGAIDADIEIDYRRKAQSRPLAVRNISLHVMPLLPALCLAGFQFTASFNACTVALTVSGCLARKSAFTMITDEETSLGGSNDTVPAGATRCVPLIRQDDA